MVSSQKESKQRLDVLLVARGLAVTREEACRLILSGAVKVNGIRADKQGKLVGSGVLVEIEAGTSPYVSRAGGKLAAALDAFKVSCENLIAMDVGASTGGFTDCLLKRGILRVYAVDVGYGQLDWKIRQNPRVIVLERFNIRHLPRSQVPEMVQLAVVDVSFISLKLVLPCVVPFLDRSAMVVALVKPQFEVGKGKVGRGGIVRGELQRQQVTEDIFQCGEALGFQRMGALDSPIPGRKGNREVLIVLKRKEKD